jgi:hypothetical protein
MANRLEKYAKLITEGLMAGIQELQDKINELQTAVSDDEASDKEVVDKLNITIQDLRDQLANNQPVDTQPLIDQLEAIKESLVPADGGSTGGTTGGTSTGLGDGGQPTG